MIFFAEKYYYTRDHLGSMRELLNSSGTILTRYSYDPYGRTIPTYESANTSTPPIAATFQYTGDYYHATSGLNLTKYRAYDSNTGRWLNRDPIKEKGGLNLYDYCRDNATDLTDPFGLATTTMTITITPQSFFKYPYGPKNSLVDITATSDCCKDIRFIQYTVTKTIWDDFSDPYTPQLDNGGDSDPWYPNQSAFGSTASMEDAPGPGAEDGPFMLNWLARFKAFFFGLSQEFVTCAICNDPGPRKNTRLACIHWQTNNGGVFESASFGPYTGN